MNRALAPIEAILAAAAVVLTIIFFVATQQPNGRDWVVISLGILIGGTLAALIATLMFHSDRRRSRMQATSADSDRRRELLAALPTRDERLRELRNQITEQEQEKRLAKGGKAQADVAAHEAAQWGDMTELVIAERTNAELWQGRITAAMDALSDLAAERRKLEEMTDEDYLASQKHLRGLD